MKPLRAAYEAISDAGIAVASGNPSLLVHKHIDAAKEAIKQAGEERRGLLEALKELTETLRFIAEREDYTFAECSQAEEIISRAKSGLETGERAIKEATHEGR